MQRSGCLWQSLVCDSPPSCAGAAAAPRMMCSHVTPNNAAAAAASAYHRRHCFSLRLSPADLLHHGLSLLCLALDVVHLREQLLDLAMGNAQVVPRASVRAALLPHCAEDLLVHGAYLRGTACACYCMCSKIPIAFSTQHDYMCPSARDRLVLTRYPST